MNPRLPWLWLFVVVNIIAAFIMLGSGEHIGELKGAELHSRSALLWATILIVVPYLVGLGPVFDFVSRIKFRSINFRADEAYLGLRMGQILVVSQILYCCFNLITGVNIAGSNNTRTDSLFAMLWVLFPVDALFIVYYGVYRENKYFYPNLVIWLVSNLIRGWIGIFMFVIFLEWCRSVRQRKIKISRVAIVGLIVLAIYPLLSNVKWAIRASAATGFSLNTLIEGFSNGFATDDYLSSVFFGLNHLVDRLQSTSMLVDVMRLSDLLREKFEMGDFAPFWMEGLHGIVFDKVFFDQRPVYIGVAFTAYENFGFKYEVGDWNVSLGYLSWFFIAPYLAPLYVIYTLFLGVLAFWLLKMIGMTALGEDLLWYVWLVYLLAPWLATFVAFIFALFVFLALKISLAQFRAFRWMPKSRSA